MLKLKLSSTLQTLRNPYRILSNPGEDKPPPKNRFPPYKVNPFMMSFLDKEDRQLLEDYILVINCSRVGLKVLDEEDLEKFKDLVFQLNLIEVGLL